MYFASVKRGKVIHMFLDDSGGMTPIYRKPGEVLYDVAPGAWSAWRKGRPVKVCKAQRLVTVA